MPSVSALWRILLSLLLILAFSAAPIACGGDDGDNGGDESAENEEEGADEDEDEAEDEEATEGEDEGEEEDEDGGTDVETRTFDEPEFDITFEYPTDLQPAGNITINRSAGASAKATEGVAIDKDNLIVVQRYGPLNFAVTERNLRRVKSEVDRVFSQAAAEPASSEPVDVGGFPALEFDEIELMRPPDGVSRIVVLFDQRTEYVINCQSTPEHRDEIEEACEVALDSLEPKS